MPCITQNRSIVAHIGVQAAFASETSLIELPQMELQRETR